MYILAYSTGIERERGAEHTCHDSPPRLRRDYPLNLSISVSGGKETNRDSLSRGDRKGKSSAHNLPGHPACGGMLR